MNLPAGIYLLDVNALLALGVADHEFHERVARWVHTMGSIRSPHLATCSITELGFARVLAQAPAYGFTVIEARALLLRLKRAASDRFTFIPDKHGVAQLPAWVKTPKQITDGHLSELANAHGGILATLDEKIPLSYVIPR
jgi:predicted nucleic acid-binding protein